MLVLSRYKNESIVINDNITITVVDVNDYKVRLGFVAPNSVRIDRQEIWDLKNAAVADKTETLPKV